MIRKNKLKLWFVCLGLLIALFIQPASYAADSMQFKVLTAEPLPRTYIGVYQDINEVFASDAQLVLIVELDSDKNKKHAVKVQVLNLKGETIYDQEKELETRPGYRKSYIAYSIALDSELKSKLIPGSMSIKLHLDGKSFPIKQLAYQDYVIKKQIAKLVVLPFYSTTNQFFDYRSKNTVLTTISDALKCRIERYFSEVIPAEISEKSLTKMNVKNCFENEDCRNNVNKIFGEGIFITGNISIPEAEPNVFTGMDRECFLEIFLFDARKNQTNKFKTSFLIRHGADPVIVMNALLNEVLNKQGLLLSIRSL